jgi:GNAT superfamily N-acetyltransferase
METETGNGSKTGRLVVRRATTADARAIAEIGVAGWATAYRGILPAEFLAGLSVAAREAAWQSMLANDEGDGAPAWIAERNRRVIGFVASGPPRDEDVPLPGAEVYAIYVLPDAWRSGAGRALLTTAVDHWRGRGAKTLVLWVLEANLAGRAFYEAMGWSDDGHRQEIDFGAFSAPEVRYRLRV